MIAPVEGATGSNTWQSPYKQQQQSTFGGDEGDNGGGGGTDGDSFMSTFAANGGTRADAARRMRDRCGRYSLLKVLYALFKCFHMCHAFVSFSMCPIFCMFFLNNVDNNGKTYNENAG